MNSEENDKIISFLKKHRISGVATIMPDGIMPHNKVMHYSMWENPLKLLFCTDDRSISVQNISLNHNMSVVVGWSEEEWITVQMRGEAKVIDTPFELASAKKIHYANYPSSQKFDKDSHTVFIVFTPSWIKISDVNSDPSLLERLKNYPG